MFTPSLLIGFVACALVGATPLPPEERDRADNAAPARPGRVVWGEAVDGLQAGIAFREKRGDTYRVGETVRLAVILRNVDKAPITFACSTARLRFVRPHIVDADGNQPSLRMPPRVRYVVTTEKKVLAPGEEMTFGPVDLKLVSEIPARVEDALVYVVAPPGRYTICYDVPLESAVKTGRLTFRVERAGGGV
ncbi:MAG TPA: hypothetical protein VFB66_08180 [Tepidisphaeraceae bacterium]|nr:hypothetical protein [Tepidisphaeraceae bacterium]